MNFAAKFLITCVLLCGLVDLPRDLTLGPVTALGLLSIIYAAVSWLLFLAFMKVPKSTTPMIWFALFLCWGIGSLVWHPFTSAGLQNLSAYAAFAGTLLLSATVSYISPRFNSELGKWLGRSMILATLLYVLGLSHALGGYSLVGARTYALFALMGVAWFLAAWRYGSRRALWAALILTLVIGASLSRMALGVALLLYPLSRVQLKTPRGWITFFVWIIAIAAIAYGAVMYVPQLHDRFFEGDTSMQVGGVRFSGSGRMVMWEATLDSFQESPWVGKGAGSSALAVAAVSAKMTHPHSEYLRFLHDYGIIGCACWVLGQMGLIWVAGRAWLRADNLSGARAQPHLAAFLALIAVALVMATDNVNIYIFVMAVLGIIVGNSLGCLSRNRGTLNNEAAEYYPRPWGVYPAKLTEA